VLRLKFFTPPLYADLADTANYEYLEAYPDGGEITKAEVEAAIKSPAAIKALGPIGIINLIL
jgi:hypothetical protein